MLSYIEALEALAAAGTMLKAATRLRLSQSAVSKRIASLEDKLGTTLIEKQGRHVILTPAGRHLLERLQPLLVEFRSALQAEPQESSGQLTIGVSESILSSWGAKALADTCRLLPQLTLEIHTHRSPVVVDRVASGEYHLGLIAGFAEQAAALSVIELCREPMVLVPSLLEALPARHTEIAVICIESRSGTWSAIERKCRDLKLVPVREMESFFAVVQLALAGFGHGLVPLGVCRTLQLPEKSLRIFSEKELSRPISLIARTSTMARPIPSQFLEILKGRLP